MTDTEPQETARSGDDSLELLTSGKIRFHATGRVITLRPPKFGEYKGLREIMNRAAESSAAIAAAARAGDADALAAAQADAPEGDDIVAEFVTMAIVLLGDGDLPEDDRPIWMTNGGLPAQMTNHWRNVPLAPGS